MASREKDGEIVRADLAEVIERHEVGLDAARPDAVARRRKTGQRTARENIEELCDPGTFVEYGPIVVAAQRRRRTIDDLIKNTPADGLVTGLATVNGNLFGGEKARCVVMSYDYTVLAGTQGHQNHRKKDRMFQIARELRLPLVLFAEGGGGRPGDTDGGFHNSRSFHDFPKLSGLVPLVGITSGRCYAGNASLLGCCDVVIATRGSNIGMGGPAMIEGGGLGIFRPEEIGPMEVQVPNGVVDIAVEDESDAVKVARKYLSYFQGAVKDWTCADQRLLRNIIPENRLRVYDVHDVIETMADTGSVLELRREFGLTMIAAFIRIEGHPFGVVANNPKHLAGAIDSDGADKGARMIQLCDAFDIPILFLCDTPGIMVGPGDREDGAGTAFVADVSDGGECDRAVFHDRVAQGLRIGRDRDGRRELRRAAVHGGVADRRIRPDGPRGRGEARLSQRAGGNRGTSGAQEALRRNGRDDVPAREGDQQRVALRSRRRDRSG